MEPLLYIAGIFLLLKVIQIAATVKNVRNIRFKHGDCVLDEIENVPAYIIDLFEQQAEPLTSLGFSFSHCQLVDEPIASNYSKVYNFVYFHSEQNCYANICLSETPDKISPVKIELNTILDDNFTITTLNGMMHCSFEIPNVQFFDHYVDSVEKQYQHHLQNVSANIGNRTVAVLLPEEYVKLEKQRIANYINESIGNDEFVPAHEKDTFKLRLLPSIKFALKAISGMSKSTNRHTLIKANAKKQNINLPEIPVEIEVDAYNKNIQVKEAKKGGFVSNLIIFVVSMLAFMISFKVSLSFAIILQMVIVLFIHELGHYIAMYLFDYKELKVMFIPFLGAATMGKDHNKTSALQKAIVYLMGPAPGIIIGSVLLFFQDKAPFIREFAIMMLILNYINLLPILPLDGGRLFELALFSKFRILKTGFLIISILLLIAGALAAQSVFLWILPAVLFASLISQIKNGKVITELEKQIEEDKLDHKDEILLPRIFTLLRTKQYSEMQYIKKSEIVKNILAGIIPNKATLGESILSLILYGLVFLSPAFIIIVGGVTMGLAGMDLGTSTGVQSFYCSPDKNMIIVSGNHNAFSSYNYLLDKNGNKLTDLDKNASFNSDLCWVPNHDSKYITLWYPQQENPFPSENYTVASEPLTLFNIETKEKKILEYVNIDPKYDFKYKQWGKDGNYLLGITFDKEKTWEVCELFRHNIENDTINSIDISELNCSTYATMNYTNENQVIITIEKDDYDSISREFACINFETSEINKYEYDDAIQCEVSKDGNSVFLLKKIYENNIVRHQIFKSKLDGSSQTVIVDYDHFPQFSFEEAARGKDLEIYFELSPKEKWLSFDLKNDDDKTAVYIFSLENNSNFTLFEYESDYYAYLNYSETENIILTDCYSFDDEDEDNNFACLFNLAQSKPARTDLPNELTYYGSYEFLNDNLILYIKEISGESEENITNELWLYNIETGENIPFE